MQVMPDETIKFLSEDEVRAELTTNPDAEIYSATGVRMKLETGKIVGLPSGKDASGVPARIMLNEMFGEQKPFAYRRF